VGSEHDVVETVAKKHTRRLSECPVVASSQAFAAFGASSPRYCTASGTQCSVLNASSVLLNMFDNSGASQGSPWAARPTWTSAKRQQHRSALRGRYVYEIARTTEWRGAGDSTLFKRVWDEAAGGFPHVSPHYGTSPTREDVKEQLDAWWQDRRQKLERNRRPNSNIDKFEALLLRLCVVRRLDVNTNSATQLEVEHVLPVQRVQNLIRISGAPGLPFNAAPNLALLNADLNVKKGSKTIGEYYHQIKTAWDQMTPEERADREASSGPAKWEVPANVEAHVRMMLLFTPEESAMDHFVIAQDGQGKDAWTPQAFYAMLDSYWPRQRDEALAVLY